LEINSKALFQGLLKFLKNIQGSFAHFPLTDLRDILFDWTGRQNFRVLIKIPHSVSSISSKIKWREWLNVHPPNIHHMFSGNP